MASSGKISPREIEEIEQIEDLELKTYYKRFIEIMTTGN